MIKFRIWHKPSQTFTENYIREVRNDEPLRCEKKYLQFRSLKKKKTVKEIFESISSSDKKNLIYCDDKLFYKEYSELYLNRIGEVQYFCTEYDDSYACSTGDEYIAQQWTGLQDKNELDIYEGDVILDVCQWKVWTVVFGKDVPSFLLSDINGAVKFFDRQTAKNDYEVIGTIFGLDKWPCKPDHNGECLICDCWLSECHLHEHLRIPNE